MAAATIIGPYSSKHFQALPVLEDARHQYLRADGDNLIQEVFRDFFVDAGMDKTFGLAMLHRHFDIGSDQKLVEYNGTSSPWTGIDGMPEPRPHLWSFDKDKILRPTEFRYSNKGDDLIVFGHKELEFAVQLRKKLEELGLIEVFGIALYPGDNFPGSCEITQGTANINLHPDDYPDDLEHIPTIWWFSEPLFKRGCRCTCNASAANHPHGWHVITQSG